MAQRVNIILEDDLDGSEATETLMFGLDGNQFEIDLNEKNAAALRKAMEKYVAAGRRTQARRGRPRSTDNGTKATTRRGSTRKRTASIEQIEAKKTTGSPA